MAVERRQKAGPLVRLPSLNPLSVIQRNPAPSLVGGVIGTQIFNSTAVATEVVTQSVHTGGVAAALATSVQTVVDAGRWFSGGITAAQAGQRLARNTVANASSVVGGSGGAAVGGAIGTAVMPGTGTLVGSMFGGIFGAMGVGSLVGDRMDEWMTGTRTVYVAAGSGGSGGGSSGSDKLEESLIFFGFTLVEFEDPEIVNQESVMIRYRQYRKVYHPDKGGSKDEWISLVNHFGSLSDAIRIRDLKLPESHKHSELSKLRRLLDEERKTSEALRARIEKMGGTEADQSAVCLDGKWGCMFD